ncbi:MAG: ArgE/DapE family deacylase [Gemmatimonadetes bacterium]|nr:ArgE/DapE family deacylase [Gemmatimonadota bacterium]
MPIDRSWCLETLASLVRINSINSTLRPGAPGEAEIGHYTATRLGEIGLEVRTHEPQPGRISVTGRLIGTGGGRTLMLNGHYDTVDVDNMPEPFSAAVRHGRLYGRGAFDMKGAVAACMTAAKALKDSGRKLRGDLIVAAVADEEYGSVGTADLAKAIKVDGAIVTEPTALRTCLAHKGYLWIEVETRGKAAHGSRFAEGIDANVRMGRFLTELERLERELRARPPHPLVGPPSLHAATLNGGTGLSTYADRCRLVIERRTVPGETEASVMGEIETILARLRSADPTLQISAKPFFVRNPFEVSPAATIVSELAAAAESVLGARPASFGDTPWMDSALLAEAGVEVVVFGPSGAGAHAVEEWVDLESVYQTAAVLAETAVRYCGVSS